MTIVENDYRRSTRAQSGPSPGRDILPKECIFCKKSKYKKGTRTREGLIDCSEFRADKNIRGCAVEHIRLGSPLSEVAKLILLIIEKDLISSEAKYHNQPFYQISHFQSIFAIHRVL